MARHARAAVILASALVGRLRMLWEVSSTALFFEMRICV